MCLQSCGEDDKRDEGTDRENAEHRISRTVDSSKNLLYSWQVPGWGLQEEVRDLRVGLPERIQ